jgi:hypothetical protein
MPGGGVGEENTPTTVGQRQAPTHGGKEERGRKSKPTKVGQLEVAVRPQQQVVGLDVSVDDALAVAVLQS